MRKKQAISSTAAALVLLLLGTSAAAQDAAGKRSHFSLDLGVRWDDNIGLAPDDQDQEYIGDDQLDEFTTGLAIRYAYDVVSTQSSELTAGITGFYNAVADLEGLSNSGLTVDVAYRSEFGPEFTDPWYSLSASYTLASFQDSRIRDGDWFELEAMVGKRFSPKFGLSGGARYFDRSQDNDTRLCPNRPTRLNCPGVSAANPQGWSPDEVFEQDRWGVFVHADWFVSDNTALFAEYSYWDGDEDATLALRSAAGGQRDPGWLNGQDVFADDPAFGQPSFRNANTGAVTNNVDFIVWKVDTTQHVFELGVRQRLTDTIGLEVIGVYLTTSATTSPGRRGDDSLDDYENTALMANLTFTLN